MSTSTLNLLNAVRRRQGASLNGSYSEGSSPCTPPSTPRDRRMGYTIGYTFSNQIDCEARDRIAFRSHMYCRLNSIQQITSILFFFQFPHMNTLCLYWFSYQLFLFLFDFACNYTHHHHTNIRNYYNIIETKTKIKEVRGATVTNTMIIIPRSSVTKNIININIEIHLYPLTHHTLLVVY